MRNERLFIIVCAAVALSIGHHADHVLRGTHVGWPVSGEVTPFTFSLGVYPAIAIGLYLSYRGRAGAGFWAMLMGGGALFVGLTHFGPFAAEPAHEILDGYAAPVAGLAAFALLLTLLAVLAAHAALEGYLWTRARRLGGGA